VNDGDMVLSMIMNVLSSPLSLKKNRMFITWRYSNVWNFTWTWCWLDYIVTTVCLYRHASCFADDFRVLVLPYKKCLQYGKSQVTDIHYSTTHIKTGTRIYLIRF